MPTPSIRARQTVIGAVVVSTTAVVMPLLAGCPGKPAVVVPVTGHQPSAGPILAQTVDLNRVVARPRAALSEARTRVAR